MFFSLWYGMNICVAAKFVCEALTCKVIEFGAGALGIYIGLDNLMRVELP